MALGPCTGMVQVRRRRLGSETQAHGGFLKQQRKRSRVCFFFFHKNSHCSHKYFPKKPKGNRERGDKPQAMPAAQSGFGDPPSWVVTRLAPGRYPAVQSLCKASPKSLHRALPKGSVRHSPNHSECPESTGCLPSPARLPARARSERGAGDDCTEGCAHAQAPSAVCLRSPLGGLRMDGQCQTQTY